MPISISYPLAMLPLPTTARLQWRPFHPWLVGALPFLVALLAYAWTTGAYFVSDDFAMLHRAAEADGWVEASHLPWTEQMSWLRPISQWSWWVQWEMLELNPLGYRLFNIALHGSNAVLVSWLSYTLLGSVRSGAAAGCAFALLPIHPEAVTWLSGRVDLLCTLGALISILAWIRYCADGGRLAHLFAACLGLAFSLGAKEMGCVVPAIALPLLLWGGLLSGDPPRSIDRTGPTRGFVGIGVMGAIVLCYFGLRFSLLGGLGGISQEGESLQETFDIAHAITFNGRAIQLSLAPIHEQFHPGSWHPLRVLPLLGLLILGGQSFRLGFGRRVLIGTGLALVCYLVSTTPVAGWSHVSEADFQSSRYLYLPTIFSCLLLGTLCCWQTSRQVTVSLGGLALLLIPWTYQLFEVNGAWNRAGETTKLMLDTLPDPSESKRLLICDLPDNHNGAYVFRVAFPHASELHTGRDKDSVRIMSREDWNRALEESASYDHPFLQILRWDTLLGWIETP